MQANKIYTSAKMTMLAAALALSGAAFSASAQSADTTAQSAPSSATASSGPASHHAEKGKKGSWSGEHHGPGMHKRMHDVGIWVPGYGPLPKSFLASLSLTDAQNKLIDEARQAQKDTLQAHRDEMRDGRKARMDQLKDKKIDPKQALASMEKQQEQAHAERVKLDNKWLAVWDALDDAQHDKIAAHFAERADKFAKRAQERKAHKAAAQTEQGQAKPSAQ